MPERQSESRQSRSLWERLVVWPWDYYIVQTFRQAEEESQHAIAERAAGSDRKLVDWKTITVCVVVAVNLALLQYFGLSDRVRWLPNALGWLGLDGVAESLNRALYASPRSRLYTLLYWVGACTFLYLVVPGLIVRFAFRQRLSEYGLGLSGAWRHLKIYVVLFMIVLPLVLLVSTSESFQQQYPFYKDYIPTRLPPGFLVWEIAYAFQFFALEFFFRGFMVHGLKARFGVYAVFVMMIPYCMIHFGKPFPETLGAVIAGLALGLLSLRTGTIWLGFLIHVSVAVSMDLAALWQAGIL